jgi:hypothetical protein
VSSSSDSTGFVKKDGNGKLEPSWLEELTIVVELKMGGPMNEVLVSGSS